MNGPNQESVELFLQEASENLQYLREYSGLLQEPQTRPEDLEKLYIAAHTLSGTSASYGFPQFSEVAAKMAHIFHYAMNATLTADMHGPLTEFISDAISVLEFDLLQISSSGSETADDIAAFKQRYAFAFPAAPAPEPANDSALGDATADDALSDSPAVPSFAEALPEDGEVPEEVLEFFVPEAEEHLQAVTECLLALETAPNPEEIHRLFRAMHTVKGSAAQVGLHRLSAVAHRVEDLIGQLRDGALQPNAEIVDICLESVDVLKKFLHRQWTSTGEMAAAVDPLLLRISELVPDATAEAGTESGVESRCRSRNQRGRPNEIARTGRARERSARQSVASTTSGKIRPHFSRPPRSHDECGGRTRHQPHEDARTTV